MKPGPTTRWVALSVVFLSTFGIAGCSGVSESGGLSVSDPRIETTSGTGDEASVYMKLKSPSADQLVRVQVSGEIAAGAELREAVGSASEGLSVGGQEGPGKGNMTEADDLPDTSPDTKKVSAIPLPAGREVELQPTGYRITLVGLKGPIESGDEYQVTLVFERAQKAFIQAMAE